MHPQWSVSFRDDVSVSGNGRELVLQGLYSRLVVRRIPPSLIAALKELAPPGLRLATLTSRAFESGVPHPLARLIHYLQQFARHGMLTVSTDAGGRGQPIATLEPINFHFRWPREARTGGRPILSRFAFLRRMNDRLVLESPLSSARIILHDPRVAEAIFALSGQMSTANSWSPAGLTPDEADSLFSLLDAAEMLTHAEPACTHEGQTPTDRAEPPREQSVPGRGCDDTQSSEAPELQTWEFHDLLFHCRSRIGRYDAPVGATYRFMGKLDPPPAVKPVAAAASIALAVPDLAARRRNDLPFAEVVERRKSIREFGDAAIHISQLGEFLYRTMRVRERYDFEVETPHGPFLMEFASRPYPSGGGLYELELYPVVQRCEGLDPGLYHYDAAGHQLVRCTGLTPETECLVYDASNSSGIDPNSVQILLVVAARFARLAWKYNSMAYAAILKHVGVLYQTMYLTATAMELAPCALGAGDSDLFAKASGENYYAETSVGEFLLGSRRDVEQDGC